jgi:5'-phosphate synthase pdxT subunit
MKIGVIALQGNVQEHIDALKMTFEEMGKVGKIVRIKDRGYIPDCDALVIPGGESTTLCRLIQKEGIYSEIKDAEIPILGTCAGLILLAKEVDVVERTGKLLEMMDIKVQRNAFGRQRESFEVMLKIPILSEELFPAVFIRAPAIINAGRDVEIIAKYEEYIVAAKEKNLLVSAFHPELTNDLRLHHYFIDMIL